MEMRKTNPWGGCAITKWRRSDVKVGEASLFPLPSVSLLSTPPLASHRRQSASVESTKDKKKKQKKNNGTTSSAACLFRVRIYQTRLLARCATSRAKPSRLARRACGGWGDQLGRTAVGMCLAPWEEKKKTLVVRNKAICYACAATIPTSSLYSVSSHYYRLVAKWTRSARLLSSRALAFVGHHGGGEFYSDPVGGGRTR